MTSSGRRVKRRNLDVGDDNLSRSKRTRKSGNSQKASRRKSKSKSLRPQRAAARNARSLFSKITGTSTDGEDEYGTDGDLSGSETTMQDSNIESEESSRCLLNEQMRLSKGKEIFLDESDDGVKHEIPESHAKNGNRRLILRLPSRDSNKLELPQSSSDKCDKLDELVGTSSRASQDAAEWNRNNVDSRETCCSDDPHCSLMEGRGKGKFPKLEDHLSLSESGKIKWGGVRARSSKRLRVVEKIGLDVSAGPDLNFIAHKQKENEVDGFEKLDRNNTALSPSEEAKEDGERLVKTESTKAKYLRGETSGILSGEASGRELSGVNGVGDSVDSPERVDVTDDNKTATRAQCQNGTDYTSEPKESISPISEELELKSSKEISRDGLSPNTKLMPSVDNQTNGGCDAPHSDHLNIKQISASEAFEENGTDRNHGADGSQQSDSRFGSVSTLPAPLGFPSRSEKMFNVVYRRSKTIRDRTNSGGDSSGMGGSSSNATNNNSNEGTDDGARRTRSRGLKLSMNDLNTVSDDPRWGLEHESKDLSRSAHRRSRTRNQVPCEDWGSSSRITLGVRPTRNRRSNYPICDTSSVDKRKTHQLSRKGSWLMLTMHEGGSRYIPQQGDEVVYLRQVSCAGYLIYFLCSLVNF